MFDTHACEPSQMLLLNQLGTYYKYDDDVSMHFPPNWNRRGLLRLKQDKKFFTELKKNQKTDKNKLQIDKNQHF